MFLDIM